MNDQFRRYMEKQEDALCADLNSGAISKAEFNKAMRELRDEERDAYAEDMERARDAVDDQWGYR